MTASLVTNVSDLSSAMRQALADLDPLGKPTILHRTVGNALVGKGLVTRYSERHFVITDAGIRVLEAIERQGATTVVVQSLGSYGWTMLAENDFGGHAITTWIRDEHSLVLSWTGAYEVSAAILDGVPLPLDQLVETVMSDDGVEISSEYVLEMAARRAKLVASPRFASELSALLGELSEEQRLTATPRTPPAIRLTADRLAVAILATPHAR
jgi:hypothetical protein